jgi:hypothetical protein
MDLGAGVVLTFLFVAVGVLFCHVRARDRAQRECLAVVTERQERLEREQRATMERVEKVSNANATGRPHGGERGLHGAAGRGEGHCRTSGGFVFGPTEDAPPKRHA